jgi:hypothetical protein
LSQHNFGTTALGESLQLMGVEVERLRMAFGFPNLKDVRARRVQHTFRCQRLNGAFALVVGIDLNQWLGPVATILVLALDFLSDVICSNANKAAREVTVTVNQLVAKLKNVIHDSALPCFLCGRVTR